MDDPPKLYGTSHSKTWTRADWIAHSVRSRAARSFSSSSDENLIPFGVAVQDSQNAEDKNIPTQTWTKAPRETIGALERDLENPSEDLSSINRNSTLVGSRPKYDLGVVHPMTIKKFQSSPGDNVSKLTAQSYNRSRHRHLKSMFAVYTQAVGDFAHSSKLESNDSGNQSSTIAEKVLMSTETESSPRSFNHVHHGNRSPADGIPFVPEAEILRIPETTELEDIIRIAESQTTIVGFDLISRLADRGYGLHDFAAWNWILLGKTAMDAVARFELLLTCHSTSSLKFGEIPLFIFFQLLQRRDVSAHALAILIQQAWRILKYGSEHKHDTSCDDPSSGHSYARTSRFDLDDLTIMVVRLLRHSRKVWPATCVNIASLWAIYARAGLVEPALKLDTMEAKDHGRLTFHYNRILSVLALAPEERPYQSLQYRQRAQFILIRQMDEFRPPLTLSREGYRAVARVQLAHSKTPQERTWADLKAKSWPPWREDKLGADAAIGVEYGISRASSSIHRMAEAGYGSQTWEKSAGILAGWDTDGSPTIQTRSISVPPANSPPSQPETKSDLPSERSQLEEAALWAARVKATRTLQEAWSCFLTCKYQGIPLTPHLYHMMFEKLVYDDRRTHNTSRSHALFDAGWEEERLPLPGDGKEVAAVSTWHNEAVSTREPLPTYGSLLEQMTRAQIRPSPRFLEFLLKHALSYAEGIKVLRASDLSEPMKQISPPWKEEYFSRVAALLDTLPMFLFAALVTSRLPFYLPPWRSLFALLAHQESVIEFGMFKGRQTITKFEHACYLLECMDSMKLDLDFEGFEKLLTIVHNAATVSRRTIATPGPKKNPDAAHSMLDTGLSVVKARFSQIVQPSPRIHGARKAMIALFDDSSDAKYPSKADPPPLPRLKQIPHPSALHAYVHFLGAYDDYNGLLDLVRWISGCSTQIMDETKEYSNGPSSMRKCLTAIRVYVEQPLVGYDEGEGMSDKDRERYETSIRLVDTVREVVESNEDLTPWPSDGEVDKYIDRAKLKVWTPLNDRINGG
ncbi:MAG: hypothetical protein Q9202_003320 [Teloschistes flavicans]